MPRWEAAAQGRVGVSMAGLPGEVTCKSGRAAGFRSKLNEERLRGAEGAVWAMSVKLMQGGFTDGSGQAGAICPGPRSWPRSLGFLRLHL